MEKFAMTDFNKQGKNRKVVQGLRKMQAK